MGRGIFRGGASGKEPTCQCRRHKRHGFDPWVGKILWRRAWEFTPVFLPRESHGQRSLMGCSLGWKSDRTEWLSMHAWTIYLEMTIYIYCKKITTVTGDIIYHIDVKKEKRFFPLAVRTFKICLHNFPIYHKAVLIIAIMLYMISSIFINLITGSAYILTTFIQSLHPQVSCLVTTNLVSLLVFLDSTYKIYHIIFIFLFDLFHLA